jgi:hypothetical protein
MNIPPQNDALPTSTNALISGARQPELSLNPPPSPRVPMSVKKRSGAHEPIDVNKIVRAVTRCCEGIADVDPMRVALKTLAGLYDGATTRELDELSIRTASSFMADEPAYSKLAARLLAAFARDLYARMMRTAQFCQRWTDSVLNLHRIETLDDRRRFLLNLTCFASCIEGLFFFGAFAYVYFLRSRGLLPGLASGTNWVFRDESAHMAFAYEVLETVRKEEPELFDAEWAAQVKTMMQEAVECEAAFADDVLCEGVAGLTRIEMREYLQYVADQRLLKLNLPIIYGSRNPFAFMELQDVQELTNFFERKVSAYQVAVQGEVAFDHAF